MGDAFQRASPIPWSRMRWAVPAALMLIHLFIAWRIWLGLVHGFSEKGLGLIEMNSFMLGMVQLGWKIFMTTPESSFYVPFFIWIIVAVRLDDLRRIGMVSDSSALRAVGD